MEIAIVYFSGTGNTKWAVEYIYGRLKNSSVNVDLYDIASLEKSDFGKYDVILLAHPIYGANIPNIVKKIFGGLKYSNEVKIIVLATFAYVNALGPFKERKELGLELFSYYNLRMFNNITTPRIKSGIKPAGKRMEDKHMIVAQLNSICEAILRNEKHIEGIGPYLVPGKIIKRVSKKRLDDNYKALSVDMGKCIACMKCVSNCPTRAIALVDGSMTFNADCTACMRCYNNCPSFAIMVDKKYADPTTYPRYLGPWEKGALA